MLVLAQLGSLHALDYKLSGELDLFSKVGFNNAPLNSKLGIYPTESFASVVGNVYFNVGLLPKHVADHTLRFGIGGEVGGVIYDGTKLRVDHGHDDQRYGSVIYNFIGGWHGYFFNQYFSPTYDGVGKSGALHARPYVLDNAYLDYNYKDVFGFKLGRYTANIDLMSGSNQGWELYYRPTKNFKLWWWSSYGRGLAFNSWIYEFYAVVPYLKPGGNPANNSSWINYGWHGASATYDYKNLSTEFYYYFSPKTYNAPGIKLSYDTNKNFRQVGFRSQSLIMLTVPIYYSGWYDPKTGLYSIWDAASHGSAVGKYGVTLNLRQIFRWNKFTYIIGLYNTFGNSDAYLGSHTMPMGNNSSYVNDIYGMVAYDFWDNSVYDGIADAATNANTTTIYGSVGSVYKKFAWSIFGRVSNANKDSKGHRGRSNEYSAALSLDYAFTRSLFFHVKVEYYGIEIHNGYKIGYFGLPQFGKATYQARYQDRSHLMANLTLKF
ncbi:outer membrane family protein [Helicobacter mehlei]|uniref:Outer membrane family protein n=1 Tax=Helicobacter mehlei TaxID=2316080 RepID=A0A553UUE8_9HELI|nr:outer membrane family protein [Helicobacter mehlei]TSA83785.1 outer membrane family protein [Helicobacter mehlei]